MSGFGRSRSRSPAGRHVGTRDLYKPYSQMDRAGRDAETSSSRGFEGNYRRRPQSSRRGDLPIPNIWSRSPSPPPRSPSPKRDSSLSSAGFKAPVDTAASPKYRELEAVAAPSAAAAPAPETAATGTAPTAVEAPLMPPPADRKPEPSKLDTDSDSDSSDGSVAGPQLPSSMRGDGPGSVAAHRSNAAGGYGGGLRPGEGSAIAQHIQAGKRVPRRGEVGWSGEEIGGLEDLGYVMSGNRNKRMNAVRLRKENQVYSEEEKRALAQFNYDEQVAREGRMMGRFKDMLAEKGLMDKQEPSQA